MSPDANSEQPHMVQRFLEVISDQEIPPQTSATDALAPQTSATDALAPQTSTMNAAASQAKRLHADTAIKRFKQLYASGDGRMRLLQDAEGHLIAAPAYRLPWVRNNNT